jgi:hypothetical protein
VVALIFELVRRWPVVALAIASALTLACSPQANGQPGSLGYACYASDCAAYTRDWLASLEPPQVITEFSRATCRPPDLGPARNDTRGTLYCQCQTANQSSVLVAKSGSPELPCVARGRGGTCLVLDSEITECSLDEPDSCQSTCQLLQRRLAEDAAKKFDAQVRFANCVTQDGWLAGNTMGGDCRFVARINGQCYTNDAPGFFLSSTPHDCALSDRQIVYPDASSDGGSDVD